MHIQTYAHVHMPMGLTGNARRWENKDFEALKHNMERSHRQLHKLLTKYDAVLQYPVKHLFQQIQEGSLARFWAVDRTHLAPARAGEGEGGAAAAARGGDEGQAVRRRVTRRRKSKRKRGSMRGKEEEEEEEEDGEVGARRQRAGVLHALLQGVVSAASSAAGQRKSAPGAAEGAGRRALQPASTGGCAGEDVLREKEALEQAGLLGAGGEAAADSFSAEVLEDIAGEMLEEAAALREGGAARTVKKRAVVSWLEELGALGLSAHASAVPAARKSLDSLLEGAVDVSRVMPRSFQAAARVPGSKAPRAPAAAKPASAGEYFMRNVAMLGRLRTALGGARNPDLSAGEVSKAAAMCEHAVYMTAQERERLAAFRQQVSHLHRCAASAAHLLATLPAAQAGARGTAGGVGQEGIPAQAWARPTVEAADQLLREAALNLQQLQQLHAGASAAARAEYGPSAAANGALLSRVAARLDEIHAAFARCAPAVAADMEGPVLASWTHDDGSEKAAGGEAAGAEGEAVGRAGGATGGLADGHGGGTWTLVSWSAVRGAEQALAQVLALCCDHVSAEAASAPARSS